jgi:hypothetical protein
MSELVDNLKKLVAEYVKQLNEVREKVRVLEEVPKAEALVGKCFKYLNNYGSNEQWWLYTKVVRAKDGDIWIDTFQEDFYEKIEFEFDMAAGSYSYTGNSGRILITEGEYKTAQKALLKKVVSKIKKRG